MRHFISNLVLGFVLVAVSPTYSTEASESKIQPVGIEIKSETMIPPVSFCPGDMVEIDGKYCSVAEHNCTKLDLTVHNGNGYVKCDEFEAPAKCLQRSESMHFCIDRYEASDKKGDLPPVMVSWVEAKAKCEAQEKRLCLDKEWTLACEGPETLPYPYGYVRNSQACNIDHDQKPNFDASKDKMTSEMVSYLDQRVPSGSMPECVSPYGVHDMTGNVDEFTINSSGKPFQSSMKGGHWVKGARNRCRPATTAHNELFSNYESSYRCCKNIKE